MAGDTPRQTPPVPGGARISSEPTPRLSRARGLVFVGIDVSWKAAISDFDLSQQIAQGWESRFSDWNVKDRGISLYSSDLRYRVSLREGKARFLIESDEAIDQADKDSQEVLKRLGSNHADGVNARVKAEVQYIVPVDLRFDEFVKHLDSTVLRQEFQRALGATTYDLAYLADLTIAGQWYQVHFGPVHSYEIESRIAASFYIGAPPVALFCSVSTRRDADTKGPGIGKLVEQALELGMRVQGAVLP